MTRTYAVRLKNSSIEPQTASPTILVKDLLTLRFNSFTA